MIEIDDAHVWWDTQRKLVAVRSYRRRTRPDPDQDGGDWADDCASMAVWHEISNEARISWLTEMVIDLHMTNGIPVETILREFVQVRQFAELGRESMLMRRAISKALSGRATEDVDEYLEIVGLA